jgi:kynurenine 3-monooxygenase
MRIAIAGAGPAGLSAAIGFARRGHEVDLFERLDPNLGAHEARDRSYPVDVTGKGMAALRALDVVDAVMEFGHPFHGFMYGGKGRVVVRFDEVHGGPGTSFSRSGLSRGLLGVVQGDHGDTVRCHFDRRVEGVEPETGQLNVEAENGRHETHGPYALIVAADGAGSAVRNALERQGHVRSVDFGTPMFGVTLNLDHYTLDENYLHLLAVVPSFIVAAAMKEGGGQCVYGFPGAAPAFDSVDDVRRLIRRTNPIVFDMVTDQELEAFATREAHDVGRGKWVDRVQVGRVVLLGDAGSPFPPCGQGVSNALQSAVVLDEILQACDDDVSQALPRYEQERMPDILALTEHASHILGNLSFRAGPFWRPVKQLVRLAMWTVPRVPALRERVAAREGWDDVRIAYRDNLKREGRTPQSPWRALSGDPK